MGTRIAPPTVRRDGRSRLGAAATVAALAGLLVALAGCGTSTSPATDATAASSPDRTVEVKVGEVKVGEVKVGLNLRRLDADGAVFEIVFDTHSVELDQDLARDARLVVGDTTWPYAAWTGDGASGHHREGELRFTAAGPVVGTITLTIGGLPGPVTATWEAEELTR